MTGEANVVLIHSAAEFRSQCEVIGPSIVGGVMTWVVVGER